MSSRRSSQDSDIAEVIWPDEIPATPTDAPLSISPVTTVISQAPFVESQRAGLTSTGATAIVCICVVWVAAGFVLWGLWSEMFSEDSVVNLVVAFIVIASVCITLQLMPGGQLQP
ncbi:hypothetical protein B0T12DRAFT_389486 [Alternaria alternata]|jgi:hypothetical protein|nr:hypothetical protein B0T12DRAFT_389486 [Alternaria alternata]